MEEISREEQLFNRYLISLNKAGRLKEIVNEIHNLSDMRDPSSIPVRSFRESCFPEPTFSPPHVSGGKNSKLQNVSKKLEIVNKDGVSVLIAKKKVSTGDVLLVEKGAVVAVHPAEEFQISGLHRCHHCIKIVKYFVTCPGCDFVVFCGYKCRYYSWNEYHRWECYGMQRGYFNNNDTFYSTMRTMFFSLQFEETALSKDYYTKEYNYEHFANLPYDLPTKNNAELFAVLKECVGIVLYLKEHTQFFKWVVQYPKYKNKSEFKLYSMIGGLLVRCHFQFQQNYIDLKQTFIHTLPVSNQTDVVANGLFLSTQWFAKSAHPNTVWFQYENYLIIKACQEIFPGDKITVRWWYVNDCDCETCVTQAKLNSFICKKCKSLVRPVEQPNFYLNVQYQSSGADCNLDIHFACDNCKKLIDLSDYKYSLSYVLRNIDAYRTHRTKEYLDYAMAEYKKILNPGHIYFVLIHILYMQFYLMNKKELSKVIDKSKEILHILEVHYGKTSKTYVNAQIYLLYRIIEQFKKKHAFTKASIQYCQSLLEEIKLPAKFYYLQEIYEPMVATVDLQAQHVNLNKPKTD